MSNSLSPHPVAGMTLTSNCGQVIRPSGRRTSVDKVLRNFCPPGTHYLPLRANSPSLALIFCPLPAQHLPTNTAQTVHDERMNCHVGVSLAASRTCLRRPTNKELLLRMKCLQTTLASGDKEFVWLTRSVVGRSGSSRSENITRLSGTECSFSGNRQ